MDFCCPLSLFLLLFIATRYDAEKAAKEAKEAKDKELLKIDKAWKKARGIVAVNVPFIQKGGVSPND